MANENQRYQSFIHPVGDYIAIYCDLHLFCGEFLSNRIRNAAFDVTDSPADSHSSTDMTKTHGRHPCGVLGIRYVPEGIVKRAHGCKLFNDFSQRISDLTRLTPHHPSDRVELCSSHEIVLRLFAFKFSKVR